MYFDFTDGKPNFFPRHGNLGTQHPTDPLAKQGIPLEVRAYKIREYGLRILNQKWKNRRPIMRL